MQRPITIIRDLNLASKFKLSNYERTVVDTMLDRLDTFTNKNGKRLCNTQFMRLYIHNLRKKASELKNFEEWEKFFQNTIESLNTMVVTPGFVTFPSEDLGFDTWFESIAKNIK